MSAPTASICARCQLWQSFSGFQYPRSPVWQPVRSITRLRERRPARMVLSSKVARGPPGRSRDDRPREPEGPFGGMNRTSFNVQPGCKTRTPTKPSRRQNEIPTKPARRQKETPEKRREDPDASFHALKMQRALASVSYGRRAVTKEKIQDRESFDDFDLLPSVKESVASQVLPGLEYITPTPIQRLAIPILLKDAAAQLENSENASLKSKMQQYLLAAETGSGKTLAYLLPTIDAIKRAELREKEAEAGTAESKDAAAPIGPGEIRQTQPIEDGYPLYGRPRAIILLPTSELVTQVGHVVKQLSHKVKFKAGFISSAYSAKVIRSRLFNPNGIDVLVSTPQLLASISESDPYVLSKVSHLIIDEADSLFDRSFLSSTSTIIDKATSVVKQLILCSATIPRRLDTHLRDRYPEMRRLVSPNLHAIPRRVQLGMIDVQKQPYQGNKPLACADIIWTIGKSGKASDAAAVGKNTYILVFVNERETTEKVANFLMSKGVDAVALNRDTSEQRQSGKLAEFVTSQPTTQEDDAAEPGAESDQIPLDDPPQEQNVGSLASTKVLVATDLGSRGIDTVNVRHVILYDVPHTTIDFIHRLGRTGRMGRRGRGVVLVDKHDRKDIVREIREAMYKGQALI